MERDETLSLVSRALKGSRRSSAATRVSTEDLLGVGTTVNHRMVPGIGLPTLFTLVDQVP